MSKWLAGVQSANGVLSIDEAIAMLPRRRQRAARRVMILSDIHANWHALVAVLYHAQKQKCDDAWFLGDAVGYGSRPVESVSFLRRGFGDSAMWVAGNHDFWVSGAYHPAFDGPAGWKASGDATFTRSLHRAMLQKHPEEWEWFRTKIERNRAKMRVRRFGSAVILFVHGEPNDEVGEYVYPDNDFRLTTFMREAHVRYGKTSRPVWLFTGHTHCVCLAHLKPNSAHRELRPIQYGQPAPLDGEGAYWINPGSVGQPRDGDPRAAYAVLDIVDKTITYHRVEYDVLKPQRELQQQGYPESLVRTLGEGTRVGVTAEHFERAYACSVDGSGVEVI